MASNIENLITAYQALPSIAYAANAKERLVDKLASFISSPGALTVDLAFLQNMPQMREWLGDRKIFRSADTHFTVTAKPYENTVSANKKAMEASRVAGLDLQLRAMGAKGALFADTLLISKIVSGTTDLCYDGDYFFGNSHPDGISGTNDNLLSASVTNPANSLAALGDDWDSAVNAMKGFKVGLIDKDDATTLNVHANHIVCSNQWYRYFKKLFNDEYISSGVSNSWRGEVPLQNIHGTALTDTTDWYAFYIPETGTAQDSFRPFVLVENEAFKVEVSDKELFSKGDYQFGGSWHGIVAPFAWFYAVKTVTAG